MSGLGATGFASANCAGRRHVTCTGGASGARITSFDKGSAGGNSEPPIGSVVREPPRLPRGGPDSTGGVRLNDEPQRDAKRKSCAQLCPPWARRRWRRAPEPPGLPESPALLLRSHPSRSTGCSTDRMRYIRSSHCNHCSRGSGDAAGRGSRAGQSNSSRHRNHSSYKSSRRDRLARRRRCHPTSTRYRPPQRTEPKPAKTDDSSQHPHRMWNVARASLMAA